MEREFHSAMLSNYEDETVLDMVETRYRMHLYQYKQKISNYKIILCHTGFKQALKTIPFSPTSSDKSVASPNHHSGHVPPPGTEDKGRPSMFGRDAV